MRFQVQVGRCSDEPGWDRAVRDSGQGCIYQTTHWAHYLAARSRTPLFFQVEKGGEVAARLLAWRIGEGEDYFAGRKRFFQPLLRRWLPSLTWLEGPVIHDSGSWREILAFMLAGLRDYAKENGYCRIGKASLPLSWYPERKLAAREAFAGQGFGFTPWATYLVELGLGAEPLWEGLYRKERSLIRKAGTSGLEVSRAGSVEEVDQYLDLLREARKVARLPLPPNYPDRRMWEMFRGGEENLLEIHLVRHGGRLIGAQPVLRFAGKIILLAPALSPVSQIEKLNANDLLTWRVIEAHCADSLWFDLAGVNPDPEAGSREEGIRHFKKKFATRYVEYDYYTCPLPGFRSRMLRYLKRKPGGAQARAAE
jgi:hypothetical protein